MELEYIPRYSVAERQTWNDDWELIHGYPYAMSPSAKGRHQQKAGALFLAWNDRLRSCTSSHIYYELDWIIDDQTVVRPDILIHCGKPIEDYLRTIPALIIEILSPSTKLKDLNTKKDLYASSGVKYYITADSESDEITFLELVDCTYVQMPSRVFTLCDECTVSW